ncbi:hypothetical protein [Pelotomaculum schinkii]|nr:hypothetical protein [Pelotomaculum schinkii]
MHETPKIFDDFLAHRLVMEEEWASIEYQIAESLKLFDSARAASCPDRATALRWMMREALAAPSLILARSRYAEDSLEYHKNQPFNDNHLRPCPLLDNPGRLTAMVEASGATSTEFVKQEDVHSLSGKCVVRLKNGL